MKKSTIQLFAASVVLLAIVLLSALVGVFSQKAPLATASGQGLSSFNSFPVSTSSVVTTSATFMIATNTARSFLRISNIGPVAIYCNLKGGIGSPLAYTGMTIFGSSTAEFKVDENPYTGAIYCITGLGTASTTILEK